MQRDNLHSVIAKTPLGQLCRYVSQKQCWDKLESNAANKSNWEKLAPAQVAFGSCFWVQHAYVCPSASSAACIIITDTSLKVYSLHWLWLTLLCGSSDIMYIFIAEFMRRCISHRDWSGRPSLPLLRWTVFWSIWPLLPCLYQGLCR